MNYKAFTITIIFIVATFLSVPAISSSSQITADMIKEKNAELAQRLNNTDKKPLIQFLHSHLSDSMEYKISFNNEFMPNDMQQQKITMDKTQYINSFVLGTHNIVAYTADIETNRVEISDDGAYAIVDEVLTETGVMKNPDNLKAEGIAFHSKTKCKNFYRFDGKSVQSDKAICNSETTHNNTI